MILCSLHSLTHCNILTSYSTVDNFSEIKKNSEQWTTEHTLKNVSQVVVISVILRSVGNYFLKTNDQVLDVLQQVRRATRKDIAIDIRAHSQMT